MARRPIDLHPEAIAEAQAAYAWYGEWSKTAAEAFLRELDKAVKLVSESPMRWPIYLHGTRHFLLKKDFLLLLFIARVVRLSRLSR